MVQPACVSRGNKYVKQSRCTPSVALDYVPSRSPRTHARTAHANTATVLMSRSTTDSSITAVHDHFAITYTLYWPIIILLWPPYVIGGGALYFCPVIFVSITAAYTRQAVLPGRQALIANGRHCKGLTLLLGLYIYGYENKFRPHSICESHIAVYRNH